jgi:hypothetical protein
VDVRPARASVDRREKRLAGVLLGKLRESLLCSLDELHYRGDASSRASKQEMPGAENMSLHARQSLHTEKSFGDIESIMTEVRIHVRDRLASGALD